MRDSSWPVRTLLTALLILFSLPRGAFASVDTQTLYRATVVITGNFEHEKLRGFAESLEEVLVKVSGDPDLAGSPEVVALAVRAAEFVESHELVDRMAGIPAHDEQGTRERPHLLTVVFSKEKIDGALRELGRSPWRERPTIGLAIGVDNGTRHFLLTRGSDLGSDHRQTLVDIAEELGLRISFPGEQEIAVETAVLGNAVPEQLDNLRRALNSEALLAGSLVWNERAFRWSSQWQLATGDMLENWEAESISFDSVFRRTLERAMRVLSGAGKP